MTYLDFRTQVRRQLEEPVAGVWSDSSLLIWTNQAIKHLARDTKPVRDEQYRDTTAGEAVYELPTASLEQLEVYFDDKRLQRIDLNDIYNLAMDGDTPVCYSIDDENITLYPTPAEVGELRFFRLAYPDEITADDDTMPFSGQYDDAIEYYVLMRAFEQISDWDSSERYANRWNAMSGRAAVTESIKKQAGRTVAPREVW